MAQWAEQLWIPQLGILGGEPLLHPELEQWVTGLLELFPMTRINLVSNGYQLPKTAWLYDLLLAHPKLHLKLGIHNEDHKDRILDLLRGFLTGPFTYSLDDQDPYDVKLTVTDSNNISVLVEYNWWFHQGSLVHRAESGEFSVYTSDREQAHSNCSMRECHHFQDGRLYKCGVVALLPDFDQQYPLSLDSRQRELLTAYQPLTTSASPEQRVEFINNLPNSIAQCEFCPEVYKGKQIYAEEKRTIKLRAV